MFLLENNVKIEFVDDSWIIWKSHNKDYTFGTYYKLCQNGELFLVIESPNDVKCVKID